MDITDALAEHSDEYIYYRTDHHWTTYGAYFAYRQYIESLGMTPVSWETIQSVKGGTVEDFYGTFYSKAKNADVQPDSITCMTSPVPWRSMGKRWTAFIMWNNFPSGINMQD